MKHTIDNEMATIAIIIGPGNSIGYIYKIFTNSHHVTLIYKIKNGSYDENVPVPLFLGRRDFFIKGSKQP